MNQERNGPRGRLVCWPSGVAQQARSCCARSQPELLLVSRKKVFFAYFSHVGGMRNSRCFYVHVRCVDHGKRVLNPSLPVPDLTSNPTLLIPDMTLNLSLSLPVPDLRAITSLPVYGLTSKPTPPVPDVTTNSQILQESPSVWR